MRCGATREHNQPMRPRIIEAAGRRFKTDGIDGSGIAALMADAGLINGACYATTKTGTDPVGELASSIQGPSASAPAQRHHESTAIIWSTAWLGRLPTARAPPG